MKKTHYKSQPGQAVEKIGNQIEQLNHKIDLEAQ